MNRDFSAFLPLGKFLITESLRAPYSLGSRRCPCSFLSLLTVLGQLGRWGGGVGEGGQAGEQVCRLPRAEGQGLSNTSRERAFLFY